MATVQDGEAQPRKDPAPALQVLDAEGLRRWCAAGLAGLTAARQEIDDLNVYPVPDGDTGTNLQLTMQSVVAAVEAAAPGMAATVAALRTGSLLGARGNSGVILSQLFRGLGEILEPLEQCGPDDLRTALVRAADSAYGAVGSPVEGTVLTVAREAARAAAETPGDLAAVVGAARAAGAASLARTPDLLPVLRAAGVVDAGGRGWCVLLEALEAVVTGRSPVAAGADLPPGGTTDLLVARAVAATTVERETGSDEFGYEVQYLLHDASDEAVGALRDRLGSLGDSLVVVGGEGLHTVHVHVDDVGGAIEAGVEAGRPSRITVTRFEDQRRAGRAEPVMNERPAGRGLVAVAQGEGLCELFRSAGALVVTGGPGAGPSTAQLLDAIGRCGTAEVVLLPNDRNVRAVADAAAGLAREAGLTVAVLATDSLLQGLVALSVANAEAPHATDVEAMTRAATDLRWAEVTTAVRGADTPAGPCRQGDVLGLVAGRVAVVGTDVEQVGRALVAELLATGGELLTIVTGAGLDAATGRQLGSWAQETRPGLELVVVAGGQPHYPLLLGVE